MINYKNMLSKIQISVDENSKPCIKITYQESDDVRDLLVKQFLENVGFDAPDLRLYYPSDNQDNSLVYIKNSI